MNTVNTMPTSSQPKSIFPDGKYLDGLGVNHKTTFLNHVLREYVGGGNKHKHALLQEIVFYFQGNDMQAFLSQNGYELWHTCDRLEDLTFTLQAQPDVRKQIKSGELSIALAYNDLYPEKIILAKRMLSESEVLKKINVLRDEIKEASGDILSIAL